MSTSKNSRMEKTSKSLIIWSYRRGSIHYDTLCILILAFIFLVPRGCFIRGKNEPPEQVGHQTIEEYQHHETVQP